jgi:hypothetical protein
MNRPSYRTTARVFRQEKHGVADVDGPLHWADPRD